MSTKIEFNEARHTYRVEVDGKMVAVPSVTTVLKKVVDKSGPLTWWAQKTALEAIVELHQEDRERTTPVFERSDDVLEGFAWGQAIQADKRRLLSDDDDA